MFEVRDGSRTLQFNGVLLGESSSWHRGSDRWIEFYLYRTDNKSYILSRVGVSLIFHGAACPLVKRYGLVEGSVEDLEDDSIPCEECKPTTFLPVVFPEKYRYWAQVSEGPKSVIDALYKEDKNGIRYLTHVARRILDEASDNDEDLDEVYRIELIP